MIRYLKEYQKGDFNMDEDNKEEVVEGQEPDKTEESETTEQSTTETPEESAEAQTA